MHYKKYAALPHEEKWDGFTLDYKNIEGFSPLFYETDGTHWDLDHDADSFLYSVIKNYWSDDFAASESLYMQALTYDMSMIEKQMRTLVEGSDFYKSTDDKDFFDFNREKHPDEYTFSELFDIKQDIESKIFKFIPMYLREVIKSDYYYAGPIDKQTKYEDTPYNHSIIRDPGQYLFQYFNDQMVFDNYVQHITVPHFDEDVVKLLDSGVLLEPIDRDKYWEKDLDNIMDIVARNYRGWWT